MIVPEMQNNHFEETFLEMVMAYREVCLMDC